MSLSVDMGLSAVIDEDVSGGGGGGDPGGGAGAAAGGALQHVMFIRGQPVFDAHLAVRHAARTESIVRHPYVSLRAALQKAPTFLLYSLAVGQCTATAPWRTRVPRAVDVLNASTVHDAAAAMLPAVAPDADAERTAASLDESGAALAASFLQLPHVTASASPADTSAVLARAARPAAQTHRVLLVNRRTLTTPFRSWHNVRLVSAEAVHVGVMTMLDRCDAVPVECVLQDHDAAADPGLRTGDLLLQDMCGALGVANKYELVQLLSQDDPGLDALLEVPLLLQVACHSWGCAAWMLPARVFVAGLTAMLDAMPAGALVGLAHNYLAWQFLTSPHAAAESAGVDSGALLRFLYSACQLFSLRLPCEWAGTRLSDGFEQTVHHAFGAAEARLKGSSRSSHSQPDSPAHPLSGISSGASFPDSVPETLTVDGLLAAGRLLRDECDAKALMLAALVGTNWIIMARYAEFHDDDDDDDDDGGDDGIRSRSAGSDVTDRDDDAEQQGYDEDDPRSVAGSPGRCESRLGYGDSDDSH
jgi:hypothetical protein